MSRLHTWDGLPDEAVRRLIAADLDSMEESMNRLESTVDQRLGSITKVLIGILVSVATASIMLAINLTVIGGA